MPYIEQKVRKELDTLFDHNNDVSVIRLPQTAGELNYAITKLVLEYLPANPRYADYNSVVGVLESAKLEFYRRAVATYENQKAYENGDVYDWYTGPAYGPLIDAEGNTSDS